MQEKDLTFRGPSMPGSAGDCGASGYLSEEYAASLAEFGQPRLLPRSRGWLLEREVSGSGYRDAMGCYPLFACQDWRGLEDDLDSLEQSLVSVAIVTDPFGGYDRAYLDRCFKDVVVPFKEHFVVDLRGPTSSSVSRHHSRYAKYALKKLDVQVCDEPQSVLDEWLDLYASLVQRHRITGLRAFSREAFRRQLAAPGLTVFRAMSKHAVVAICLWYVHGDVAYYHLGAASQEGYAARASFAIFWQAIDFFAAQGLSALDLGAGAGLTAGTADGLTRFKAGWSTRTLPVYLCGRILNQSVYLAVTRATEVARGNYFPAYRSTEFE